MVQRCKFSIELKNFPPDLSGEPVKPRMEATVNVTCYKSKVLKNGESPLMVRICKNGKKKGSADFLGWQAFF